MPSDKPFTTDHINQKNNSIMIVDDDLFVLTVTKNILQNEFKVITISDDLMATDEYFNHSPDIVFLDVNLPNKKGSQILEEILTRDPDAYIVMMSADATSERITEHTALGAKGFIAKPFKSNDLYDYIEKCLSINAKP